MDARAGQNTRKTVKYVSVTMAGRKLGGRDRIKVICFLRRLKRDADRDDTTESLVYLAQPYMLRDEAQEAFGAADDDGGSRRNIQD